MKPFIVRTFRKLGLGIKRGVSMVPVLLASHLALSSVAADTDPGLYSISATTLEGKSQTLEPYRGKVLLIVNTASKCGYTPQYSGLKKLFAKYRDKGFVVLGFPSNDFGGQEPGSGKDIRFFCKSNYAVDFPMFAKGPVSGVAIQPVFNWLLKHSPSSEEVSWNFEKFLVGRNGAVLSRFKSDITPESEPMRSAIERALRSKPALPALESRVQR